MVVMGETFCNLTTGIFHSQLSLRRVNQNLIDIPKTLDVVLEDLIFSNKYYAA